MRHKSSELMNSILEFVENFILENRHSPSTSEIAEALDSSKATVYRYLMAMNENGMIQYDGKEIVTGKTSKARNEMASIPLVGAISCGIPLLEEEHIEEYVSLPTSIFGRGEFFLLKANGDSMIESGIDHGDLVLIRRQSEAKEGQIVVALVNNENTLKRYFVDRENNCIRLHPENRKMKDIIVDNKNSCMIQGVAVNVIKSLD